MTANYKKKEQAISVIQSTGREYGHKKQDY